MSGSEAPQAGEGRGSAAEASRLAASIAEDFRSLIETFDRLLEATPDSDRGIATALWAAHAAARRGLQLSEMLSIIASETCSEG